MERKIFKSENFHKINKENPGVQCQISMGELVGDDNITSCKDKISLSELSDIDNLNFFLRLGAWSYRQSESGQ